MMLCIIYMFGKKIFKGEEESEAGLGISEEEFEQRVDSWFK